MTDENSNAYTPFTSEQTGIASDFAKYSEKQGQNPTTDETILLKFINDTGQSDVLSDVLSAVLSAIRTYPLWNITSGRWNGRTPLDLQAKLASINENYQINPVNLRLVDLTAPATNTVEIEFNPQTMKVNRVTPTEARTDGFIRTVDEYTQNDADGQPFELVQDLADVVSPSEDKVTWEQFKTNYEAAECTRIVLIPSLINVRVWYYDAGKTRVYVWLPVGEALYEGNFKDDVAYHMVYITSPLDYIPLRFRDRYELDKDDGRIYVLDRNKKPVYMDLDILTGVAYTYSNKDGCEKMAYKNPSTIRRSGDLLSENEWNLWSSLRKLEIPTVAAKNESIQSGGILSQAKVVEHQRERQGNPDVYRKKRYLGWGADTKDPAHIIQPLAELLHQRRFLDRDSQLSREDVESFVDHVRHVLLGYHSSSEQISEADQKSSSECHGYLQRLLKKLRVKMLECLDKDAGRFSMNAQQLGDQQLLLPVMIPLLGARRRITVRELTSNFPSDDFALQQWQDMVDNHRYNPLFLLVVRQMRKLVNRYLSVLAADTQASTAIEKSQFDLLIDWLSSMGKIEMPSVEDPPKESYTLPLDMPLDECNAELDANNREIELLKRQAELAKRSVGDRRRYLSDDNDSGVLYNMT
jgi:hypothetical protein